jgi:predicted MPP superfamily phosphohydrolase
MSRFFVIALGVFASVHLYLWSRLVYAPELGTAWTVLLSALAVLLFAIIPLTFLFGRRASVKTALFVLMPGYIWLGALFLLFVSVAASDVLRGGLELWEWFAGATPQSPEESLARARWQAQLAAGVAGLAFVASLVGGRKLAVKRVSVPLSRLPTSLNGTTIVQLTDVHIGPTRGRRFLERVVDAVNALEPDVIAITGDLVDGSVTKLAQDVAPLARLKARHGVFFVTGNHEYYSGAEPWCAYLTQLGLRVLRNERVRIGEGEESYDLAGIDDLAGRQFGPGQGADLDLALLGRDSTRELVLLAHQPRVVLDAERAGVGLQLSGHTHGGQIWPFHYLVRLQQPVNSGLARFGRSLLYVSNGTGYWGPPMRLGSPAEITELTLQCALASAE